MRSRSLLSVAGAVAIALAALPVSASASAKADTYHRIATHYEAIRSALASDATAGIRADAMKIRATLRPRRSAKRGRPRPGRSASRCCPR